MQVDLYTKFDESIFCILLLHNCIPYIDSSSVSVIFFFRKEINITQKSSVIRAFNLSFYTFTLPTMMFVVFSVYGALEGVDSITPRKVFTTYSLLSFLRVFSAFGFVNAVSQVSEGTVALKRIEVSSVYIISRRDQTSMLALLFLHTAISYGF